MGVGKASSAVALIAVVYDPVVEAKFNGRTEATAKLLVSLLKSKL